MTREISSWARHVSTSAHALQPTRQKRFWSLLLFGLQLRHRGRLRELCSTVKKTLSLIPRNGFCKKNYLKGLEEFVNEFLLLAVIIIYLAIKPPSQPSR
jgi:hypothetical protein